MPGTSCQRDHPAGRLSQEKLDTRISSSVCILGNIGSASVIRTAQLVFESCSAVAAVAATLPRLEGGQWVSFDELETSANCLCSFRLKIFLRTLRQAADLNLAKLARSGEVTFPLEIMS